MSWLALTSSSTAASNSPVVIQSGCPGWRPVPGGGFHLPIVHAFEAHRDNVLGDLPAVAKRVEHVLYCGANVFGVAHRHAVRRYRRAVRKRWSMSAHISAAIRPAGSADQTAKECAAANATRHTPPRR